LLCHPVRDDGIDQNSRFRKTQSRDTAEFAELKTGRGFFITFWRSFAAGVLVDRGHDWRAVDLVGCREEVEAEMGWSSFFYSDFQRDINNEHLRLKIEELEIIDWAKKHNSTQ
jgi:hypothetical protein